MSLTYHTLTLPNKLRIVHIPTSSPVAYCGLAVNAGSRDEVEEKFGLAHFVEHTIFKGTKKRRSWHILNRMERIGGELNAYTAKEETLVYSIFPTEHFERAVELIADLIANSTFPDGELEKEREVVIDEINSYRDTPSEAIYDDYEDLIFSGHKLGHNILGSKEDLNRITSSDCRAFLDELYVPENMVFFSMGNQTFKQVVKYAEKHLGVMNHSLAQREIIKPVKAHSFIKTLPIDSHQSHTVFGAPTFGMFDDRKYALSLLTNILGGPGMNSILNVLMREKRGYVYTVEATSTLFSDCGLFTIYFGSDDCHVKPCLKIINNQFDVFSNKVISDKALDAAKRQYLGQLLVSYENKESVALAAGKSMLYFDKISSLDEVAKKIQAIAPQEIQDMATLIGDANNYSILTMD